MSLLAAMPMGALVLDERRSVLSANRAILDLLGYPETQVVGQTFDKLVLAAPASEISDLLTAARPDHLRSDVSFLRSNGGNLLASVCFSRVQDSEAAPRVLAILISHADQTDALRPTSRADEALSFARAADWEYEIATGSIRASRSWYGIWGLPPQTDASLDGMLQQIHPADREAVLAALRHTGVTGTPFHIRFRLVKPGGTVRWAESKGRLDLDGSGLAGRIYGEVMDVTERYNAEQALARYADIVSASPDRIAFVDRGCRLLAANQPFLAAIGREDDSVLDKSFKDVCGEGPLTALLYRNLGRCLDLGQIIVEDIRETDWDDAPQDAEVRLFPHRDDGAVTGIVINIRDVTSVRESERRLLQSAAVYAATSEGVLITDASGTIVSVNAAFTQITGYTEAEVIGNKPNLLNSQWHPKSFFVGMWRRLLRHGSWQGEIWNRRKDGDVYWQKLTIRRVLDARGKLVNFVGVFAERTGSPTTPQRAEHLIHYDALTKLPNRLLFESRVEHAIELGHRKESQIALLLLDLDRFSHINSSLGHHIGDELLRAVALKLREAIRPSDTLARLRADQFGLLFEEIGRVEEVTEIAQRLQATLGSTLWVHGHEVFVTVSMGIALNNGADVDRVRMFSNAEAALRQVKRQGRNGFRIATTESDETSQEQRRIIDLLRSGLGRREFHLLYRLGFDMLTKRCVVVQAKIHWMQQELGMVPPERFLPLANDCGLILELGNWALATACQQLQTWTTQGISVGSLSLSVSEAQLTRGDLVRTAAQLLDEYPLVANRLELEFSETLLVKHREQIAEVFNGLNRLGVLITLSEVGAGWTAPAVLQRLPIKTLMIHPSFIECLPDSVHDRAVVQAIIDMSQALTLTTRADGVRSDKQFDLLATIGCQQAMGDLWGEPDYPSNIESKLDPKTLRKQPKPFES